MTETSTDPRPKSIQEALKRTSGDRTKNVTGVNLHPNETAKSFEQGMKKLNEEINKNSPSSPQKK